MEKTIMYRFADGTVSIIETGDEWCELIAGMDWRERLHDRKETRRYISARVSIE